MKEAIKVLKHAYNNTFKAAKSIVEKAQNNDKIEFWLNKEIIEIKGEGLVNSVVLKDTVTGEVSEFFADEEDGTMGIFVFIGFNPATALVEGKLNLNNGYIVTDPDMKTNIEGVFACGDVREKSLRQVVTAAGDGAIAAVTAEKYVDNNF